MPRQNETPALGAPGSNDDAIFLAEKRIESAPNTDPAQVQKLRNPRAVREARLELMRAAIFENLGAVRLFVETAQLLIEARDDTGMAHAVKMGTHHYRAAVQLAHELSALKAERGR